MKNIDRRFFLKLSGILAGASALGSVNLSCSSKQAGHVVILGGGTGGATAAKYIKIYNPDVKVTVVERNKKYVRCYGSNEVLTEEYKMSDLTIGYEELASNYNIDFVFDEVIDVEATKKEVILKSKNKLSYDRLIVSPGIDFKWNDIEGYDESSINEIPHAWKAGEQTVLLKKQIDAMPDNGLMVIAPPVNPFRCPPGPYERASLLAEHFMKHKPKAKIIILDPKDSFTKDQPFMLGWNRLYGSNIPMEKMHGMPDNITDYSSKGLIEWISGSNGGTVKSLDIKNKIVTAANGESFKADVINIIPAQKAGKLAFKLGLANKKGWCDNDKRSFESTIHPNIHVIGDACVADAMPKSGYSANSQAKVCARAVVNLLAQKELDNPVWSNACHSKVGKYYGVSIEDIFRLDHANNKIIGTKGSGGVSPLYASSSAPRLEALYQESWMRNFVTDCFT